MNRCVSNVLCVVLCLIFILQCGCTIVQPTQMGVVEQPKSPSSDDEGESILLIHGLLIDGNGGNPIKDAAVLISDGLIKQVGPTSTIQPAENTKVIDLEGATILPGFINAHVHDAFNGERLKTWAQAGVTTVRDESILDHPTDLEALIKKRNTYWSTPDHARLISAGYMITPTNGYGFLWVDSVYEAQQMVQWEIDSGVDLIKVALENGYNGVSGLPNLTEDELAMIVKTAREAGLPVSAHVTEAGFMEMAVEAGVDDLAHMWNYVTKDQLRAVIKKGIIVNSTLTVMDAYKSLDIAQHNLGLFVELGGLVAMGSDYTYIPQNGFDHFELGMPMHELECMTGAGMTNMQIIESSTRIAAQVCKLQDSLGTIEPGKIADILVVNGNPLVDLQVLTDVRLVIHNGVIIREKE